MHGKNPNFKINDRVGVSTHMPESVLVLRPHHDFNCELQYPRRTLQLGFKARQVATENQKQNTASLNYFELGICTQGQIYPLMLSSMTLKSKNSCK